MCSCCRMLYLSRFDMGFRKNSDLISLFVSGLRLNEFLPNLTAIGHDDTDWRRAEIGLWAVNVTWALKWDSAQTETWVLVCVFSCHRLRRYHLWKPCRSTLTKPSSYETWRAPSTTTTTTGSTSGRWVWLRWLDCSQRYKHIWKLTKESGEGGDTFRN